MKRKLLSLLLVLALLIACLPRLALPASAEEAYSGVCGKNLSWRFDPASGTLTISGTGEMYAFNGEDPDNREGWPHEVFTEMREVVIEEGVSSIGLFAFLDAPQLSKVSLPAGLRHICEGAFAYCGSLREVTISEGLETMDKAAFYGCTALTGISLPEGLTEIPNFAFTGCSALERVAVPDSVSAIGYAAFNGCSGLQAVSLGRGVQRLESYAFWGCSGLTELSLPASVQEIGYGLCKGCTGLKRVILRNPDCRIETGVINRSYAADGSQSSVHDNSEEDPTTLGISGQTLIYGAGGLYENTETTVRQYESGYRDEKQITEQSAKSYAGAYGYRFIPLDSFRDVDPSAYYAVPTAWAAANGIGSGTGDGCFSPKKTCTREQVVSFLYAAAGKPGHSLTESPFEDVEPGKYYYHAVLWAAEQQITGGVSKTSFGVGKPCTREQVLSFLWKAAGSPEPETAESDFSDVQPGRYYFKAVLWARETGVTGGVSAELFGVGRPCTRAQVVSFLYKVYGE